MLEHLEASHGGEGPPVFNFKVVKSCKSSLERQVREAVRIQMRGVVLNKKGMYNRCKLTRMVVDQEWENKVWKDAWASRETIVDEECLEGAKSSKINGVADTSSKRIKRDEAGVAWGAYWHNVYNCLLPQRFDKICLLSINQDLREGGNNGTFCVKRGQNIGT